MQDLKTPKVVLRNFHSTTAFTQSGCGMRDANFPKLLPCNFLTEILPHNFPSRQIFLAFTPTVDLLFDVDFSDLFGFVNFLAT